MKLLALFIVSVLAAPQTFARDLERLLPWTTEFISNGATGLDFDTYSPMSIKGDLLIVKNKPFKGQFKGLALYNYNANTLESLANCSISKTELLEPNYVSINGDLVVVSGKSAIGIISRTKKNCLVKVTETARLVGPRTIDGKTYFFSNADHTLYSLNLHNASLVEPTLFNIVVNDFDGAGGQIYLMTGGYQLAKVTKFDIQTRTLETIKIPDFDIWSASIRYFDSIRYAGNKILLYSSGPLTKYSGVPAYYVLDLQNVQQSYWGITKRANEDDDYYFYDFTGATIREFEHPHRPTYAKRFPIYVNHLQPALVSRARSLLLLGPSEMRDWFYESFQVRSTGIFQLDAAGEDVILSLVDFNGKEINRVPSIKISKYPTNVWLKAGDGKIIVRNYEYPRPISVHDEKTLQQIAKFELFRSNFDITAAGGKLYVSPDPGNPGTIEVLDLKTGNKTGEIKFSFPPDVKDDNNAMQHHSSILIQDGVAYVGEISEKNQRAYLIIVNMKTGEQRTLTADCGQDRCLKLDTHTVPHLYMLSGRIVMNVKPDLIEFDLLSGGSKFISVGNGAWEMSAFQNALWIGYGPGSRSFGGGNSNVSAYSR